SHPLPPLFLLLYASTPPRDLHSFPTRRSSDLPAIGSGNAGGKRSPGDGARGRGSSGESARVSTGAVARRPGPIDCAAALVFEPQDRKSTRLNSSHVATSYAVFCLKKKTATTVR